MTSSTRLGRAVAAAAVALAALVLAPLPASAHTALVGSSPEEGETVTSLDEVSLEFTEQLLEIGNELALEAPDGTVTALEIEEPITETITAAVPASTLGDGVHVLRFRVVSADGHPIEGEVTFTVEAPVGSASASPSASPSVTATPTDEATAASSTPSPTPTAAGSAAEPQADAIPDWALIAFGVAGAAALAAAIVVAARRGRPQD